jgi:alpha-L-rhamnosidase
MLSTGCAGMAGGGAVRSGTRWWGFMPSGLRKNHLPELSMRVTGADVYRVWCNGQHAGYGPARTAHGHSRVDEWPLDRFIRAGVNHLAIEVLSYGIDSYACVMQPPFLQAEIVDAGKVVAATGEGFSAYLLPERVQKIERFSKQRPFAEAYRLGPGGHEWRTGAGDYKAVKVAAAGQPRLLPRGVRLPRFDCVIPVSVVSGGAVVQKNPVPPLGQSAARDGIGTRVRGFPVSELEIDMSAELNRMDFLEDAFLKAALIQGKARTVPASGHVLYDFGIVQGGFIGASIRCAAQTRVYLMFDELRDRGPGRLFALGVGAVALDLQPGIHEFESMEPYTFRYVRVIAVHAAVDVEELHVREYAHPAVDAAKCPDDPALAKIFRAARQTFRTNSIDLFTDCMSRERGGYPCDAWFTARAERVLTGESRVERNFLENYFLVDTFSSIPAGMVPHCYPSDRLGKGQYIPNWGLWLVIQLCDYCRRNGDEALRDLAGPRVEALFKWFEPCLNEIGLLENVPGWVFVEWSPANDCTSAVNHPINILYAHALAVAAEIFGRPEWAAQAERMRAAIRQESWDGRWFADQSVRIDGKLQRSKVRTETCQYHALAFGVAEGAAFADLWRRLRDEWGPRRGVRLRMAKKGWEIYYDKGVTPRPDDGELAPAALLYGLMLRFDLLQRYGERDILREEICRVFGPQAEQTGTLWEHCHSNSSCNHGFASCACEYILSSLAKI